jgi:hypothetical protein
MMPEPLSAPALAALLQQAGHALPPDALASLAEGHAKLVAMLALLPDMPPAAEPATVFRPTLSTADGGA